MRPSSSSKSRPWTGPAPGAQRPVASLQVARQTKRSPQAADKDKDRDRDRDKGRPGSLAAALSQYQPSQKSAPSSLVEVSYQPEPANQPAGSSNQQLLIRRAPRLSLVKCLLLGLMGLDLALTCLLYQLAKDDQLQVWRWRLRLSLVNLLATAAWFALLIGALLFHLHRVLIASALLHLASFGLLLVLSLVHFARRIDYNTVHLAKLLALLFAIIMLHVYLLVMAALTLYLARGVRRRRLITGPKMGPR